MDITNRSYSAGLFAYNIVCAQSDLMHANGCLQVYFPNIFDIKYLMKFCGNLHGGLNKLAETLEVERIGPQHQVTRLCGMCQLCKHLDKK